MSRRMARARFEVEEALVDPFGELKRARDAGPVVDGEGGAIVTRHEAMRALLADRACAPTSPTSSRPSASAAARSTSGWRSRRSTATGAEHLRWRALMSRTFTPRSVERLRPFLRDAAHELIDGFAARGRCEFMAEFADVVSVARPVRADRRARPRTATASAAGRTRSASASARFVAHAHHRRWTPR